MEFISTSYTVCRTCSLYGDFVKRSKSLTAKLMEQGYTKDKLKVYGRKFYGRCNDLIQPYRVSLTQFFSDIGLVWVYFHVLTRWPTRYVVKFGASRRVRGHNRTSLLFPGTYRHPRLPRGSVLSLAWQLLLIWSCLLDCDFLIYGWRTVISYLILSRLLRHAVGNSGCIPTPKPQRLCNYLVRMNDK